MKWLTAVLFFFISITAYGAGYQFWTADQPDSQGITHYEWTNDGGSTWTTAAVELGTVANTVKMVATATNPGETLQVRACIVSGECGPESVAVTVLPGQPNIIIQWSN